MKRYFQMPDGRWYAISLGAIPDFADDGRAVADEIGSQSGITAGQVAIVTTSDETPDPRTGELVELPYPDPDATDKQTFAAAITDAEISWLIAQDPASLSNALKAARKLALWIRAYVRVRNKLNG